MTRYLGSRPAGLPRLPALSLKRPTPAMQAAARAWLNATASLSHLDGETVACGRPGLASGEMLTDREFAQRVCDVALPELAALEDLESVRAVSVCEAQLRRAEYDVRDGYGVMNTRFLRCGLFSSAQAEHLPVLRSRTGDWVLRRGKPLGQDHLDFMMAVLAGTSGRFDAKLGEAIAFSPYQVCETLGMSKNHAALAKLKEWAADLMGTVIELHEPEGPHPERPTMSQFLGSLTTLPREEVEAMRREGTLPAAPAGTKVFWQVVVPAVVFTEFVKKGVFSGLRLDVRRALNSPFQKWLASYMSTHEPGRILAFSIPELAEAGGLNISTATEHGRKNQRRAVREAFAVLESGRVPMRRGRLRLSEDAASAAREGGEAVFEVRTGTAQGAYVSQPMEALFKPLVRLVHPAGETDPDTVFAMRI